MRVFLFAGIIAALQVGIARAEWTKDERDLAKAETAMIEYLADVQRLKAWSAFGRGSYWGAGNGGQTIREETFFTLISKSTDQPDAFYYAHGVVASQSTLGGGIIPRHDAYQADRGQWEQFLRRGKHRYGKNGYVLHERHTSVDESGKIEGTDREWRLMLMPFDPLCMPAADYAFYLIGTVTHSSLETRFLQKSRLLAAEVDPLGRYVKGAWVINNIAGGGGVATIVFSAETGWKPVSSSRRRFEPNQDPMEVLKDGVTHSLIETRWEPVAATEDKQEFLPTAIRISMQDRQDGSQSEHEFYFKWKLGEAARAAFPEPDDRDWREPMRKLFDEDFTRLLDRDIDARPLAQDGR